MAIIALISDFGNRDWFVAELKGIILSIAPQSTIVDISHEISPGDLYTTAFILSVTYAKFPAGTIFCQTVDPGSKSDCPIIIVKTAKYTFFTPDNGTISWVFKDSHPDSIHICTNQQYCFSLHSTFRGRDIIVPAAAHYACGIQAEMFGPEIKEFVKIPFPHVQYKENSITTEIVYIDNFGNIITAIENQSIQNKIYKKAILLINNKEVKIPVERYYYEIKQESILLYQGSSGFVEIAVNESSAAAFFNARRGDKLEIIFEL
jgi:S-adenosylmethionine hydrolase